ncbi:MAG: insulinase family protein [Lactobacillaceae bacterium]|jgi:predicted Zn-dependent peptidase|nr:insulinase family protein [Lactobacillaceae bacterium]
MHNIIKLPNGIEVVNIYNSSPLIKLCFLFKAGSTQDMEGKYGLAHFLEHMTFNGTRKRSKIVIENSLSRLGKRYNASTDYEQTYYQIDVLKEDVDSAMNLLSDMVCNSVFSRVQINREREVVIQELKEFSDIPEEILFNERFSVLYAGHGLAHPVLGFEEDLDSISKADFYGYTDQYYCKNNLRAIFVGNISQEEAVYLTQKHFSCLPDGNETAMGKAPFNVGYKFIKRNLNSSIVNLCFNSYDTAAKQVEQIVLQSILEERIYREATNQSLSYSPECLGEFLEGCSLFDINGRCSNENVNKLIDVFISGINDIKAYPVSDHELLRAKKSIKIGTLDSFYDNSFAFASAIGRFDINDIELDYKDKLNDIDNLTKERLHNLAMDIFSVVNLGYFVMGNKINYYPFDKVQNMLM